MFDKALKKINYIHPKQCDLAPSQVLKIQNLKVSFKNKLGYVQAVRSVDLSLSKREIIGIVGESGSGKSVTVKSILGFNEGSITDADCLNLNGINILSIKKTQWPFVRGTKVGYIPQDPLMSLDPTKRIKNQILDAIKITQKRKRDAALSELQSQTLEPELKQEKIAQIKATYSQNTSKESMQKRMLDVLNFIGIENAQEAIKSYPHEFSGGMRQRIIIAITIIGEPDVIIADEPTTALDVTIQSKVISLIKKLRDQLNISIIFISHNIALVANLCDYVYIMYAGQIVEKGTTADIFTNPCHPYTWALISSIPDVNSNAALISIPGTPPSMISPPKGDAYAARNKYARKIDFEKQPPLFKISKTHYAATWLLHPSAPNLKIPDEVLVKVKIAKRSLALKGR